MKFCLTALPGMDHFFYDTVYRLPWKIEETSSASDGGTETAAASVEATAHSGSVETREASVSESKEGESEKKTEVTPIDFFFARAKLSSLRLLVESAEVRFCNGNNQQMTMAGADVLEVKNARILASQEVARWRSSSSTFGRFELGDIVVQLPMDYVPCLKSGRYPDREGQAYRELCRQFLEQNEVVVLFACRDKDVPDEIAKLTPDVKWSHQTIDSYSHFDSRRRVIALMKEMSIM